MALEWSRGAQAKVIVFDCMDELSAFAHAPASLLALEHELLRRADLVFTGDHTEAIVTSIRTPDRNGRAGEVTLGYDNVEGYLRDRFETLVTVGDGDLVPHSMMMREW